ncbi:MAG: response regulator [Planctomycetota bacterium]|jgi:CheY-like chemotaxis protein
MTEAKILVVDDDKDSLDLISEALSETGYEIICASSGPDALLILQDIKPAVVILDIMMPGMSGFAVLKKIRSMPDLKELPVIIVTACPIQEYGQYGTDSQQTYIFCKPLNHKILVETVKMCVSDSKIGVKY